MHSARIPQILLTILSSSASLLSARELSTFRGIHSGRELSTTVFAGKNLTDVRTLHQQPALMQEMDWQPNPPADSVRDALLTIYKDRAKMDGMTADDIIESISAAYGTAARPAAQVALHSIYGETAAVIARWEDPEAQTAPHRELERQKKRDEEARLVLEKARSINKPNFRP